MSKDSYWWQTLELGLKQLPVLAILGALFTWIIKLQLDRAVEKYKATIGYAFNTQLEAYKSGLQEGLEQYKTDLKLWVDTMVVRHTRAFKETVDRLVEIYVTFEQLDKMAGIAQRGGQYDGAVAIDGDLRTDDFIIKANHAEMLCFTSRLFLNENVFAMVKQYANEMQLFAERAVSARRVLMVDEPNEFEILQQKLNGDLRPLLDRIRTEFGRILREG